MSLVIATYLWGTAFQPDDVSKLAGGLRRNLKADYRFVVVTDRPALFDDADLPAIAIPLADRHLLSTPGCFARLRLFDPEFQSRIAIACGPFERLACIDLDSVVTGPCDAIFARDESFVIMQGGNSSNPNPYGGALMMLRRGEHADVWSEFSLEAAAQTPHFSFPDDQGWLRARIPDAAAWQVGPRSGVYCFKKPGWPLGDELPRDARIVTFRGNNPPSKHTRLRWVREHWRA